MPVIDLTPQEVVACRQLLEVALKTVGRNAVAAYMQLDMKLEKAVQEENQKAARANEPFPEDSAD